MTTDYERVMSNLGGRWHVAEKVTDFNVEDGAVLRVNLVQVGHGADSSATLWFNSVNLRLLKSQFQYDSAPTATSVEQLLSRFRSEDYQAEHRLMRMAWDSGMRP